MPALAEAPHIEEIASIASNETPPLEEVDKDELKRRFVKETDSRALANTVKNAITLQKKHMTANGLEWDKEKVPDLLEGSLRGFGLEACSNLLRLDQAETVYHTLGNTEFFTKDTITEVFEDSTLIALDELPVGVDQNGEPLRNTKGPIIKESIVQSLDRFPVKRPDLLDDEAQAEFATAYAHDAYYRNVIPDGLVVDENGEHIGVVEVKAYRPAEVRAWLDSLKTSDETGVDPNRNDLSTFVSQAELNAHDDQERTYLRNGLHLGFNLRDELDMLDNLRVGHSETGTMEGQGLVVLRFPADIPNDMLVELGEYAHEYGYQQLVVQKLPFTGDEIRDMVMDDLGLANIQDRLKEWDESDKPLENAERWGKKSGLTQAMNALNEKRHVS